jgi:cell fate regulator YaaT (PSP1 superfamily)
MPILPLPQFEADLEADRLAYEALKAPKSIVVRFGAMKMVGEFPYEGDAKPGCGSKLVARTPRGTELCEMLTTTCSNSGCGKSVSRQEMLRYIENSGGRDYPFFTDGRVLRVATMEDIDAHSRLEQKRHELKVLARALAERLRVGAKIVDAEPILGRERLTIYFMSEARPDFADFVREMALETRGEYGRIDMRSVGARDEARITADYERCGQYCCCKNFLKVLKPISMKSAKTQKATLDPLKISGRCGRLMCCLRYEDETYEELKKKLPRRKTRVGTPEGDGLVLDGQILTQLVLVLIESSGKQVAIPVEDLTPPAGPAPAPMAPGAPAIGSPRSGAPQGRDRGPRPPRPQESRPSAPRAPAPPPRAPEEPEFDDIETDTGDDGGPSSGAPRRNQDQNAPRSGPSPSARNNEAGPEGASPNESSERRRRRRRRRRGGGGPPRGDSGPNTPPPSPPAT